MLAPRRQKYRKQFKPKSKMDIAVGGTEVSFGEFGLRVEEKGNISSRQIEAARKAITHFTKRGGRVWIRIFPDRPLTKKPPETRMGGGKGDFFQFVAPVKIGRVIFEMSGVPENVAKEALRLAGHKLSIKSTFLKKESI
ncbi:MAG: 50S ribosomal protein L16 [Candidatus Levybacteria bacterium CG_4_10_14_0_2_um_filter_36_16]|nr:MAG: 50S ribosomal protein L16 [Candidatus Levybacteria bacterium CG2_30_37_29]PIR79296.1 MAG: 50S ribosomal protein L16 [Candidatus Levybacteria bacterium CG10_big_fil_rev_8_21_14_0_10_36_30]PIZ97125.1 MAG: 50S ribosomal protein L16 [Candidatus Levybacteria bacterium CG_4_10_14_0_2_um_filter_36_16]PJA90204.1 MAG: 50S ribosomal protein L16 [Candidatus Levybacteria bacterium CG_4_9_14_3_um_filter_36_7]